MSAPEGTTATPREPGSTQPGPSASRSVSLGHRTDAPYRLKPAAYPRHTLEAWFRGSRAVRGVSLALVLLTLTAYGNTLANGFVGEDHGTKVETVESSGPETILTSPGERATAAVGPVVRISFALDHAVAGLRPWFFHLTNLVYHLITSFVVFVVIARLLRSERLGAVAAILFCVHPVQTGAASCVAGRPEILSTMFALIAFDMFLRRRSGGRWWTLVITTAAYVLAVLSKSATVVLPAVFFLHDLTVACRNRPERRAVRTVRLLAMGLVTTIRERGRFHLAFLGFAASLVVILSLLHGPIRGGVVGQGEDLLTRVASELNVLASLILLVVWPARLVPASTYASAGGLQDLWQVSTLGVLVAVPALLTWALTRLRTRPQLGFGVLWFLTLFFASSPLLVPHAIRAEHDLYLPFVGVVLVLAVGFRGLERQAGPTVAASILILVTAMLAGRTILRNRDYRSAATYWAAAVAAAPEDPGPHVNLARTLVGSGDLEGAIGEMRQVTAIDPRDGKAHFELGTLLEKAGEWKEAERAFLNAVEANGALRRAWLELAVVERRLHRPRDSVDVLERASSRWPNDLRILTDLAESHRANGRSDLAKAVLVRLAAAHPSRSEPFLGLGRIALDGQDYENARKWLAKARELAPEQPRPRLLLGECLIRLGRNREAIGVYARYLEKWPDAANRYRIRGTLLRLRREVAGDEWRKERGGGG
jgi:Flp pilus assembly protein TadD